MNQAKIINLTLEMMVLEDAKNHSKNYQATYY